MVTVQCLIGRAASFAGTQCLSRTSGLDTPTAATTEANRNYGMFRSIGEALQKKAKKFLKTGSHRSALDMKKESTKYRKGPRLGKTPGLGPRCL